MKLRDARICIEGDCEEIFVETKQGKRGDGRRFVCPSCMSEMSVPLSNFIKTMHAYEKEGCECCTD